MNRLSVEIEVNMIQRESRCVEGRLRTVLRLSSALSKGVVAFRRKQSVLAGRMKECREC